MILRQKAGVKPGKLPPYIEELLLDAVRHFSNFAAHPEKDIATGEIIDVEPGEAEWCLEIVEKLFDHYFVQPARAAARKIELDSPRASLALQRDFRVRCGSQM